MEDLYYFSKETPVLLKRIAEKGIQNGCKVTSFKDGTTLFLQGEGDSNTWSTNAYWNFQTNKTASLIEWVKETSDENENTELVLAEMGVNSFLSVTFRLSNLPFLLVFLKEIMENEGGFISFQDELTPRYYFEDMNDLYLNISQNPPEGLQSL